MPDTFTANLNLTLPEVGASADSWGTKENANFSAIDACFTAAGSGTAVGINIGGNTLTIAGGSLDIIPSGTVMIFAQTSAPTGWTKLTTSDDAALRVVSGTAGTGGSAAFSSAWNSGNTGSYSLLVADVPALSGTTAAASTTHTHNYSGTTSGQSVSHTHTESHNFIGDHSGSFTFPTGGTVGTIVNPITGTESVDHTHDYSGTTTVNSNSHTHTFTTTGGGGGHAHTIAAITPKYVDVIQASRN